MYIGLDISTATTGFAVIDDFGALVELGYVDTHKEKTRSLWEVADKINKEIVRLAGLGTYDHLFIEESLQRFRSGFSSAHTISTLAKINGITSYLARQAFNVEPEYISSSTARKACGVKLVKAVTPEQKKNTRFVKQQVFDQVVSQHIELQQQQTWPKTRPSTQNPTGRFKDCCYDMVDAYVIVRAGWKNIQSNTHV